MAHLTGTQPGRVVSSCVHAQHYPCHGIPFVTSLVCAHPHRVVGLSLSARTAETTRCSRRSRSCRKGQRLPYPSPSGKVRVARDHGFHYRLERFALPDRATTPRTEPKPTAPLSQGLGYAACCAGGVVSLSGSPLLAHPARWPGKAPPSPLSQRPGSEGPPLLSLRGAFGVPTLSPDRRVRPTVGRTVG